MLSSITISLKRLLHQKKHLASLWIFSLLVVANQLLLPQSKFPVSQISL